jgi:hypothetical protein
MSLWWLVYNRNDQVLGVVIIEAASLVSARMRAALGGLDVDATFAEGHELDAKRAAQVQARFVGRVLSRKEAAGLLDRVERGREARTPGKKRQNPPETK